MAKIIALVTIFSTVHGFWQHINAEQDQRILNYKTFATVQALLNEWRGADRLTPSEIVSYEEKLSEHLTRKEEATRLAIMIGGPEELYFELQDAISNNDMQWALELSDHLIALDYFIDEVKDLRIDALIYEGSRSSNPNKRNYFLSSALELNGSILDTPLTDRTSEELLQNISISQADSPSGFNLNALGFYLLVSLFFIIATMIEFAYILLVCRVTGEVDNNERAGKPKLNQPNSNDRLFFRHL